MEVGLYRACVVATSRNGHVNITDVDLAPCIRYCVVRRRECHVARRNDCYVRLYLRTRICICAPRSCIVQRDCSSRYAPANYVEIERLR